jgi:hypothetical protein
MYFFYNVKLILYLVSHRQYSTEARRLNPQKMHFIVPCRYNIPILQIIMCCFGREFEDFV